MSSALDHPAMLGGRPTIPAGAHASWPEIRVEDEQALRRVLASGKIWGTDAPEISALEREWAQYVGVPHCLALNSGTAALHCGIVAVDIQPGDEVIVPAFSFVATALAVAYQGAVPVFCDIDPQTFNIDPARIHERIADRTRAILVVHIHGLMADMDPIAEIAEEHGLVVIEDAAQAHGATYHNRRAGAFGACAAFSLNATKSLPGGEGGLFVTSDPELALAARRLSVFGEDDARTARAGGRLYDSHGLGYNYRHHELSAALARAQLRRLDAHNQAARANAEILTEGLRALEGVSPPHVPEGYGHVFHKYRVRLELDGFAGAPARDAFLAALRAEGVEACLWQTRPLPAQPVFRRPLGPWHPARDGTPMRPFDPADWPETSRLLDSSLVLGSERAPLAAQSPALMRGYVDAVAKVLASFEQIVQAYAS